MRGAPVLHRGKFGQDHPSLARRGVGKAVVQVAPFRFDANRPRNRLAAFASRLIASSLVGRVERAEHQAGRHAGDQLRDEVDQRRPAEQPHRRAAQDHGGVERAAGDPADGERAGEHRETDRQAVEGVAG